MRFALIAEGKLVGYRQEVGRLTLYSRDGYAFSGRPIDHEQACAETTLRTREGRRVFHGDVVEVRLGPGAHPEERLITLDADGALRWARPGQRESSQCDRLELHVGRRRGSVFTDLDLRRAYAMALSAASRRSGVGWGPALRWSAAVLGGAGTSAVLQLGLLDGVGPVMTLLGSAVALIAATWFGAKHRGSELTVPFLHRSAGRAAAVSGVIVAGVYARFREAGSTGGVASVGETMAATAGVLLITSLATYALVVLVGSTFAYYASPRHD
ncbi:MAG: hypothetical protein AAGA56_18205 [Myxococcota bacterium]